MQLETTSRPLKNGGSSVVAYGCWVHESNHAIPSRRCLSLCDEGQGAPTFRRLRRSSTTAKVDDLVKKIECPSPTASSRFRENVARRRRPRGHAAFI